MKAVRLHRHGGPEVLTFEDVETPAPGPGQLLIRVEAVAVNYADTMRRRNDPYPFPSEPPFIPGGEVAGTVETLGDGVEGPPIGTAVFATVGEGGLTGYAQFAVANAGQVIPIPPGLDAAQASALVVAGVTAVLTMRYSGRLQPGESVLVQAAAGGVGSYAVQLAKLLGEGTVIAAAGTEEKRQAALALGADHAVDYTVSGWSEQVRALTGGNGVDLVLEMTGGSVFAESLAAMAPFGRSVVYGLASQEFAPFDPQTTIVGPNQSVIGFYLGGYFMHRSSQAIDALQFLIGQVLSGAVKVQVGQVLPLSRAADAHRMIENRETTGKIILQPWTNEGVAA